MQKSETEAIFDDMGIGSNKYLEVYNMIMSDISAKHVPDDK